MKTATFSCLLFFCFYTTQAQRWQGQLGTNVATLPGRSLELTSAWSPNLNQWALTFNAGYTYHNPFGGFRSGYACDCGVDNLKTSGAFVKVGSRKRTDYFLFDTFISHQPGIGLTDWKNAFPGLQGIVGLNYGLGRL